MMRILVISDIHANETALDAVLSDAAGQYDACWCLGDIIGYGPDVNRCVAKIRDLADVALTGNHDWAALGKMSIEDFNPAAQFAARWTSEQLNDENRAWLNDVPAKAADHPQFMLAHGSPLEPVWEYIVNTTIAYHNFQAFTQPFCFVGHTHYPAIFKMALDGNVTLHYADYDHQRTLDPAERLIINPGSVGQPRDGDPRAAYGLLNLDTHTWQFKRVPYDINAVQKRMTAAHLPESLINRLAVGM